MNTKNNSRYKTSSDKIETAFLTLLLNNKYEDITISQICKQSNINRSTFYCHYSDINDLIIKIENKFAKSITDIFGFGEKQSNDAFVEMFTFVKNNKYFYKAFLNIPYKTLAETDTKIEILKHIGNNPKIDKSKAISFFYRASFFGAGIKEICRIWLERDCKESPEEMARLLLDEYSGRDGLF